ncbi:MAG: Uma2 family endonuclease [Gomphosphaeria aponina SAG 52.96 = DSM 107014]|uniref:Uma2 family endonuclease n=1 Tax=Gomphosphaeria aponina SAG 52.96 = DSM 107014 TaxID=1521640 RepID=A0A941GW36_9CHRO|nr:Uma2 family endonuclease [Gomphosphaeria aponina SAG 52.96 = DSM 107014]
MIVRVFLLPSALCRSRFCYSDRHPHPQDIFWLIEVSRTTLDKDKNEKKRIYAAAGIEEYWVIDLNAKELIVWRQPSQEDYQTLFKLNQGIISPVAFPDVELEVKKMLQKSNDEPNTN